MKVIGRILTPFAEPSGGPIQPSYARGAEGRVIVDDPFAEALSDVEDFERVWLIYLLHRAAPFRPRVVPFRDTRERGLFATRAPCRPNPIGLSAVRLLGREGNVLWVADVDMLDGTPLLDIKPYVPEFDSHPASRAGWLDVRSAPREISDDRFAPPFEVLPDGSVVLGFEGHCVQTAAKNAHRELTAALLTAEGAPRGFGGAVDLLAVFLEETDFAALRAGHPGLDGSVRCRVRVFLDGDGQARWEVPGAP